MVETENNHKALLKIQKDEIKIDCRDSLERQKQALKPLLKEVRESIWGTTGLITSI